MKLMNDSKITIRPATLANVDRITACRTDHTRIVARIDFMREALISGLVNPECRSRADRTILNLKRQLHL